MLSGRPFCRHVCGLVRETAMELSGKIYGGVPLAFDAGVGRELFEIPYLTGLTASHRALRGSVGREFARLVARP